MIFLYITNLYTTSSNIALVIIYLSEVQTNTVAELIYNSIVGWNLGRYLLFYSFCSQLPPHNAIRDEFGTSLSQDVGKAYSWSSLFMLFSVMHSPATYHSHCPKKLHSASCIKQRAYRGGRLG